MLGNRDGLKIVAVDLDDTLCTRPLNREHLKADKYNFCTPLYPMIETVNKLYDKYKIVIYTARGMNTYYGDVERIYFNLYTLTYDQLLEWGVKFDELVMGKIHYDIMIDDKVINSMDAVSVNAVEGKIL